MNDDALRKHFRDQIGDLLMLLGFKDFINLVGEVIRIHPKNVQDNLDISAGLKDLKNKLPLK